MGVRRLIGEISGTLFANAFVFICCALFPLIYDVRWKGFNHYHALPSTLITITHKRDPDIVITAPVMHLKKTLFHNHRRMHFVAREDMFDPGFVNYHLMFPFPRGPIIHRLNVSPFVRGLRAHPISFIVHQRVAPLLRDVLRHEGNIRLGDTLSPAGLAWFAGRLPAQKATELADLNLSTFLSYGYRNLHDTLTPAGILKDDLAHKLRAQTLKQIGQQVNVFIDILNKGGICMVAPEGDLSPDGKFSPIKSLLYRLLSRSSCKVTIQPVNITYDFMTLKRMRIYVDIGQGISFNNRTGKIEAEQEIRRSIVALGRVTVGQIASEYFLRKLESGEETTALAEMRPALASRLQILQDTGLNLDDRLLTEQSFEKRLADFINYCLRKEILKKQTNGTFIINPFIEQRPGDFRRNPVRYSYNELLSLLEQAPKVLV